MAHTHGQNEHEISRKQLWSKQRACYKKPATEQEIQRTKRTLRQKETSMEQTNEKKDRAR